MATQLMRLVQERRRRLVASIMGHAEREFFDALTEAQQQAFRAKVLQSIDEFADLVRDLLKVQGEDVVVNEHALQLLEALHHQQATIARQLR
jgi:hypothetical protein